MKGKVEISVALLRSCTFWPSVPALLHWMESGHQLMNIDILTYWYPWCRSSILVPYCGWVSILKFIIYGKYHKRKIIQNCRREMDCSFSNTGITQWKRDKTWISIQLFPKSWRGRLHLCISYLGICTFFYLALHRLAGICIGWYSFPLKRTLAPSYL